MKITREHRKRLEKYLQQFYKYFPKEKFNVFHAVKFFKNRCRRKKKNSKMVAASKDAWCGVCGDTGSGKSYLVTMMGILFGRPFDLTENITYMPKGQEIVKKFDKLTFQVLQIDEAAKEMRAINFHSKAQQAVNVKAMTDRFKNNWVLLLIPNFSEFTKSMRIGSILFRFVVLYRSDTYARVVLHRKSKNFRSLDPWCDKMASERYDKYESKGREITNEIMLGIERGLPNYVMDFIVPNLELVLPNITDEYQRLKKESRKVAANDESLMKPNALAEKYKKKYESAMSTAVKAIYLNTLGLGKIRITKKAVSEELGITLSTLNKYLNRVPNEDRNFRRKLSTTDSGKE